MSDAPGMMTSEELNESREIATRPASGLNPFSQAQTSAVATNAAAGSHQAREVAEVQAALMIARRFPRDQLAAMDRILQAFTRPTLAEKAQYQYSKGGTDIIGPSIRSAETIAQLWGNIQFGIRELEQRNGESTVEAFAWDIETNTRQVKQFQVPHIRYTKSRTYKLEDPREIYEHVANTGARRLRACILGVIPGDVIEAAMDQADVTLKTKAEVTPERLASLLEKFSAYGVTKSQIEKRIQRRLDAITPALLVSLGKIYNSLRDGMSESSEWFEAEQLQPGTTTTATSGVSGSPLDVKKGAAALKAGAKAAADVANSQSGAPTVTLSGLLAKMDAAAEKKDVDVLDAHATLIDQLPENEREKARETYNALRNQLKTLV